MKKKTIYLHIGYHKTGTTSIQHALFKHHKQLQARDIDYPIIGLVGKGNHNLAWNLLDHRRFDESFGTLQELLTYLKQSSYSTTILSSEEFDKASLKHIKKLRDMLSDYDVRIIVYVRRQDQLIQAVWAQRVKTGGITDSFKEWFEAIDFEDISALSNHKSIPPLDYSQTLENWGNTFGHDKIYVKAYERSDLHENMLVDLLKLIGFTDLDWIEINEDHNVTPSIKTLEFIRQVALRINDDVEKKSQIYRTLFTQIRDLADELGWNTKKINLIDQARYNRIMAVYETSNHEVARKYLGRDKLFLEPFVEKQITTINIDDIEIEDTLAMIQPIVADLLLLQNTVQKRPPDWRASLVSNLYRYPNIVNFIESKPWLYKPLRTIYRRLS